MKTMQRTNKLSGSRQAVRGAPVMQRNAQRSTRARAAGMNIRCEKVGCSPRRLTSRRARSNRARMDLTIVMFACRWWASTWAQPTQQ
jgi:hypothetical protein